MNYLIFLAVVGSLTAGVPKTLTLNAVGDLMVHVEQVSSAKTSDGYDFNRSFEFIKDYLKADLTVGNLETVFGGAQSGYTGYPAFNTPDAFAAALKNAGFNLLTTANNHSNDRGETGVLRTLDVLKEAGLESFGTYRTQESRDTIFIKNINGFKIAFLSYTYDTNGIPTPAGKDYLINRISGELIIADLKKAKSLKPDLIIVMPHTGVEYATAPSDYYKKLLRTMVQYGADIVLASHPHVLQPTEFVEVTERDGTKRTAFIAYSLGNFISSQRTRPRDAGIILHFTFEKSGGKTTIKEVAFTPTWVKYLNKAGNYDITVLPVAEALNASNEGEAPELRARDAERLAEVLGETTRKILKTPSGEIKNKYVLEQNIYNTAKMYYVKKP